MDDRSTKVIALLDVLGFESLLRERGLERMLADYKKLIAIVEGMDGCMCLAPIPNGDGTASVGAGYLALDKTFFSDTFLIWSDYDAFKLPAFCQMCSDFFCQSMELGLPIRGGIAVGTAHMDSKTGIFMGLPLVEAARAETAQDWLGISFGASFACEPYNRFTDVRTVLPCKFHHKREPKYDGLLPGIVLDWPRHWRQSRKTDVRPVVRAMNLSPSVSRYYENALRFVEFSEGKHDWHLTSDHVDYGS